MLKQISSVAAIALFGVANASAAILINDPFTDGADPQDATWVPQDNGVTLSVTSAGVTPMNNALLADFNTQNRSVTASFTSTTLANIGDKIRFATDFRLRDTVSDANSGLRFALLSSVDSGYYLGINPAGGQDVLGEDAGTSGLPVTTNLAPRPNIPALSNTARSVELVIERINATDVSVGYRFDGSVLDTRTTDAVTFAFSRVQLRETGSGFIDDVLLDNVVVEYLPVPEPTSLAMLAAAPLALRRRR